MASRRDELNAFSFARKRTVGAFLQPSGGGNDEDAPRPLRAVLPSFVVGAVVVAGFGMWGVIKPSAPQGWDNGKYILQGRDSSARYVVLEDPTTHQKVLHPVLNMASARLVLSEGATVQTMSDDVLDKYRSHGATIGIPYAPDKLPKEADAGTAKKWSVCDKPGADGSQSTINQSVFVAADDEAKTLAKPGLMLGDGQSLFVAAPPEPGHTDYSEYLVDPNGFKHAVGNVGTSSSDRSLLEAALFTRDAQKEQVTKDWVKTLQDGEPINFPKMPDGFDSSKAPIPSNLRLSKPADAKVGRLLKFQDNSYFVVGKDRLYAVSPFTAELIRNNPALNVVYPGQQPQFGELTSSDYSALADKIDTSTMKGPADWPTAKPAMPVNGSGKGGRTVICSTFEGVQNNTVKQSVWADVNYPAPISSGSASAHVTPGHGLVFRSVDGTGQGDSGFVYLITDTGLRYSLPAGSDGGNGASPQPSTPPQQQNGQTTNEAQARLGYKNVTPTPVPSAWAGLVPGGPALNTNSALQAQNA